MNNPIALAWPLVAGAGLGLFYYGGLWLTVQRLPTARRPALLALASFWVRTAATLGAFYLITGGRWERLAVCMVGFVVSRFILVRRSQPEHPSSPRGESL